jgi:two-component system response regulator
MPDKTILIVEDNPEDKALIVQALQKSKVTDGVVVARDGVEALEYIFGTGQHAGRETSRIPMLVLIDLALPKLSGLELLQRIRSDARTRYLPVVILTNSKEERDRVEGYRLGVNSYIQKPADLDQFVEAVQQVGLYWLRLNQPAVSPAWPA